MSKEGFSSDSPEAAPEVKESKEQFIDTEMCVGCPVRYYEITESTLACKYFKKSIDRVDGEAIIITSYMCSNPRLLNPGEFETGYHKEELVELT